MNIETEYSSPARISQGSVLLPVLYSIFTSDFKIPKGQSLRLFAGDTAIITKGKVSNVIVKKDEKRFYMLKNILKSGKLKYIKIKHKQ